MILLPQWAHWNARMTACQSPTCRRFGTDDAGSSGPWNGFVFGKSPFTVRLNQGSEAKSISKPTEIIGVFLYGPQLARSIRKAHRSKADPGPGLPEPINASKPAREGRVLILDIEQANRHHLNLFRYRDSAIWLLYLTFSLERQAFHR